MYNRTTEFFNDINLVKCLQLSINNVINKHIRLILYINYINDSLIPNNLYENVSDENDKYHVIELLSNIRNDVYTVIEDCLNKTQNTLKKRSKMNKMSIKNISILILSIISIALLITNISLLNRNKTVLFIQEDSDYKRAVQYYENLCKSLQKINDHDFITPIQGNINTTDDTINKITNAINTINANFSQQLLLKIISIESSMQILRKLQDNLLRRDIGVDILADFFDNFDKIIKLLDEQKYRR